MILVQGGLHVAHDRVPAVQAERHADPRRRQARAHAGRARRRRRARTRPTAARTRRRARRAGSACTSCATATRCSRSRTRPTATPNRWRLIAEANGDRQPPAPAARHAAQPPAARLMPAAKHVASASIKVAGQRLDPEDMDHVEKIEVRNFVGLPDMATIRMADPEGRHVADPPFFIGDEIEIMLGDIDATNPSRRLHRRDRHVRAGVHDRRGDDLRPRLRQVAPPAPQPPQRDVPGHDAVRRRQEGRRRERPAGRHDRLRRRPSTRSCSRAWSPTSTSSTGSRRCENCEFGVSEGKAFLRQRRNGGGTVPTLSWRENVKSFKPRMSAAQQHDKRQGLELRPGQPRGGRRRGDDARAAPARGAGGARQGVGVRRAPSCSSPTASRTPPTRRARSRRARSTSSPSGSFEAEGTMEGNPAVKAGGKLKLEGFGPRSTASTTSRRSPTSTATATSARASRSAAATRAR